MSSQLLLYLALTFDIFLYARNKVGNLLKINFKNQQT